MRKRSETSTTMQSVTNATEEEAPPPGVLLRIALVMNAVIVISTVSSIVFTEQIILPQFFPDMEFMPIHLVQMSGAWTFGFVLFLISDSVCRKHHIEIVGSVIFLITSVAFLICQIVFESENLLLASAFSLYAVNYAFLPSSISFFLEQIKYRLETDMERILFLTLWCVMGAFLAYILGAQILKNNFGNKSIGYFYITWHCVFSLVRTTVLFLISNKLFSPRVSCRPIFTVILITVGKIRRCCDRSDKYEGDVHYYHKVSFTDWAFFCVERFWSVILIGLFFVPFGFMYTIIEFITTSQAINLVKSKWIFIENFQALYSITSVCILPIYFLLVVPLCNKKRILRSDLQQIGFAEILLCFAILCCAILHTKIELTVAAIPRENFGQVRLFNMLNSTTEIKSRSFSSLDSSLEAYGMRTYSRIKSTRKNFFEHQVEIHNNAYNIHEKTSFFGTTGKSLVFVIDGGGMKMIGFENITATFHDRSRGEKPIIYLYSSKNASLHFKTTEQEYTVNLYEGDDSLNSLNVTAGEYTISNPSGKVLFTFDFGEDSMYAVLLFDPASLGGLKIHSLILPRVFTFLWILPTVIFYTLSRSIQIVYGMRFCAYQCPPQLQTYSIGLICFLERTTDILYGMAGFELFLFDDSLYIYIILSVHIMFVSLFIYTAVKCDTFVFKSYEKI